MDNAPKKISAFEKRLKRQVIGKPHRFLAVVPLGFEQTFVDELDCLRRKTKDERRKIESEDESVDSFDIKIVGDGKVEFTAKLVEAWKIAAYSRIANRIQMHIADFKAENFRDLERKAADVPWELFLDERGLSSNSELVTRNSLHIHATCKHSRLYHSDAVAERLYKVIEGGSLPLAPYQTKERSAYGYAIDERLKTKQSFYRLSSIGAQRRSFVYDSATPSAGTPRNAPTQNVYVTLIDDRCTIWLDLAGEELYKRGHERFVNDAPLKETIAAAMIFESIRMASQSHNSKGEARPHGSQLITLLDLMAGSGTFSLEAAYAANRLIPGVCRDFALKHQPAFKEPTWRFVLDERNGASDSRVVKIVTSDISEKAVSIIKHNVESAPLPAGTIDPQVRDFFSYTAQEIADACPGESSPVILLNPPYGKRLDVDAPALYTRLGRRLAELARALEPLEKHLTVGILAPKDIPASKYTCTANLLRECPSLDHAKNPDAKCIVTSHGGLTLNVIFARI